MSSKCKGTAAGLSQLVTPLGQQALPPFMCVTESTYGRTQPLYRNPHMVACFRPSAFQAISRVFYGDQYPVNTLEQAESFHERTLFHYGNQAPPLVPRYSAVKPRSAEATYAKYHVQRLVQHKTMPHRLKHAIRGMAYKDCIYERASSNTDIDEMKIHLEHQGFTEYHPGCLFSWWRSLHQSRICAWPDAAFASSTEIGAAPPPPSANFLHAYCARASLVNTVSATSNGISKK